MTSQSDPRPREGGGRARVAVLALIVLVGVGGVVGFAYYWESVSTYVAQQGWNPGAAENTVRQFIQLSAQPTQGRAAAALVDATAYEPVFRQDQLAGLRYLQGQGRNSVSPTTFAQAGTIKLMRTELLARDGGAFRILVQFANGKWGEFRVKREAGTSKIIELPDLLLDAPPVKGRYDY